MVGGCGAIVVAVVGGVVDGAVWSGTDASELD